MALAQLFYLREAVRRLARNLRHRWARQYPNTRQVGTYILLSNVDASSKVVECNEVNNSTVMMYSPTGSGS